MKATSAVRAVFGCATATRDPSKARDLTTKRVVRHGLVATALVSLFLALLRGTNHRPTKMAKIHPMLPRPMETVDACWGTLMEPVESRNVKSFSLGFFQVSKERTSPRDSIAASSGSFMVLVLVEAVGAKSQRRFARFGSSSSWS